MDIINIHDYELVRNADGFYTLGNEELDRAFGLDQNTYVSAPSQSSVENFTALAYIYGLMGYQASNFTACPTGFIVTFKRGDQIATFNTNENILGRNRAAIINDLRTYAKSEQLEPFEEFILGYLSGNIAKKEQTLLKSCVITNSTLETSKNEAPTLKANRELAAAPFDPVAPESLNNANCNNNHELLKRMCRSLLGFDVDGLDLTKEQEKQVDELYDKVLFKTILRFYTHHVGRRKIKTKDGETKKVPVRRDFEILSAPYAMKELLDLVKSRGNIGLVTTIAATDFNADVVYEALDILTKCASVEDGEETLKKVIPDTPYSYEHDKNMRDILAYWTRHNQSPHKVRK